jgi:hypothetical protein
MPVIEYGSFSMVIYDMSQSTTDLNADASTQLLNGSLRCIINTHYNKGATTAVPVTFNIWWSTMES